MKTTRTQAFVIFASFVIYTLTVVFIGFCYGVLFERNQTHEPTFNLVITVDQQDDIPNPQLTYPDAGTLM